MNLKFELLFSLATLLDFPVPLGAAPPNYFNSALISLRMSMNSSP